MQTNKNILLTGGHAATTGIAVVEELKKLNSQLQLYWAGPVYAMEGKKVKTLAYHVFPKIGVEFYPITFGRLQRKLTKWSILALFKVPIGFIQSVVLLLKLRPKVIVSFGGYAAFPIVVVGWLFRIPIIIHDQTYSFNLANKISSPFATKIALSRENSLNFYPKKKSVITGNPVMNSIRKIKVKQKKAKEPLIYVTGGSSGSQSINSLIASILVNILKEYKVIHQVGSLDYRKFRDLKNTLDKGISKKYIIYKNISPFKVAKVIEKSDIIVSRAGANSVSEIIFAKRPALLIPLTISKWQEQRKNALFAQEFGIAKVLNQNTLTGKKLRKEIKKLDNDWEKIMAKVSSKKSPDLKASVKVVDLIKKYI